MGLQASLDLPLPPLAVTAALSWSVFLSLLFQGVNMDPHLPQVSPRPVCRGWLVLERVREKQMASVHRADVDQRQVSPGFLLLHLQ